MNLVGHLKKLKIYLKCFKSQILLSYIHWIAEECITLKIIGGYPKPPGHKRGLLLPVAPLAHPVGFAVYWHSKWYRHDVELEEHTGCANAHYLRKSVVYNNNNASSVFYPPRIFTISIIMYFWFLMHNVNVVSTTMFDTKITQYRAWRILFFYAVISLLFL